MPPRPRPRGRSDFEIAIICALVHEANAIEDAFDHIWEDEDDFGYAPGDLNQYTTGMIGKHNVVLAYMPDMGSVSAANVATSLAMSFSNIHLAIVAGICGGVPQPTNHDKEVFLGDLAISTAIVQYDFGRQYPKGFEKKIGVLENASRPGRQLRAFINKMQSRRYYQSMQQDLVDIMGQLQELSPDVAYPGIESDMLFQPDFLHKHRSSGSLDCECGQGAEEICQAAHSLACNALGCNGATVNGRQRPRTSHLDLTPETHAPAIHFGTIGSANTVMKSGRHREEVARAHGLIALEMEGAGIWETFPCCLVVKSVCDYADSHKNKIWQTYSAFIAAAGVKALLRKWEPVKSEQEDSRRTLNKYWMVQRPISTRFTGRSAEMTKIQCCNWQIGSRDVCFIQRVTITDLSTVCALTY
ncbi:nucleoside phosphorylase domain-containing protein [Elsinoe ampelina]|uniref:Nucleoside phosphorylase domain-containing protein n=1 Tax=Elsinoe ampelina TaxID=302913 RepID=A0A6A6G2S1_9PEZI|nr:nucleoside phosphorylase domain-containing protein [Elsinoe ampelina]